MMPTSDADRRTCSDELGRTYAVAAQRLGAIGLDQHISACGDHPYTARVYEIQQQSGTCPEGQLCADDFRSEDRLYGCILIRLEGSTTYCRALWLEEP